jgi:hypothetical protein
LNHQAKLRGKGGNVPSVGIITPEHSGLKTRAYENICLIIPVPSLRHSGEGRNPDWLG